METVFICLIYGTLYFTKSCYSLLLFQAELYRVKKEFDKAEPLYLEAINILEESFGPEDIRYSLVIFMTMAYESKGCTRNVYGGKRCGIN
jgi:hypothetical protein